MTGDNIEEVVDLLLVVHGDLGVAGVTADWMIAVPNTSYTSRLLSPAAFLRLEREGHFLSRVYCTVDDEHRSVLSLVDLVSLAVQAEN